MELFAKIVTTRVVTNFCKKLHLRCLTGFWIHFCLEHEFLNLSYLLVLSNFHTYFRGEFRTLPNINDEVFLPKELTVYAVNCFRKKAPLQIFDRVLNTPLYPLSDIDFGDVCLIAEHNLSAKAYQLQYLMKKPLASKKFLLM